MILPSSHARHAAGRSWCKALRHSCRKPCKLCGVSSPVRSEAVHLAVRLLVRHVRLLSVRSCARTGCRRWRKLRITRQQGESSQVEVGEVASVLCLARLDVRHVFFAEGGRFKACRHLEMPLASKRSTVGDAQWKRHSLLWAPSVRWDQ